MKENINSKKTKKYLVLKNVLIILLFATLSFIILYNNIDKKLNFSISCLLGLIFDYLFSLHYELIILNKKLKKLIKHLNNKNNIK